MKSPYEIAWQLLKGIKSRTHDILEQYTLSELQELTGLDSALLEAMQKKFLLHKKIRQQLFLIPDGVSEYDALEDICSGEIRKHEKDIEALHQGIESLRQSIATIHVLQKEGQSHIEPWHEFLTLEEGRNHDHTP